MTQDISIIAMGGNSLIDPALPPTVQSQFVMAKKAVEPIAELIEAGHRMVITHGNGPQVGFMALRSELSRDYLHEVPLDSLVANTQGSLGYMIQRALGEQFRHRFEGNTAEILVESRDDNTASAVGEVLADLDDVAGEELRLVDADHIGVGQDLLHDFRRGPDGLGSEFQLVMGDDEFLRVPLVEGVLEDLDFLAGDGGESDAPDQFLGFPREHAPADHLDPPGSSWPLMHGMI